MIFGTKIRTLREKKGLVLRQLAALLEIDTATMSKIERGDRPARKSHLIILADNLNIDYKELHTLWLADKVYNIIEDDTNALNALKVAEDQVIFQNNIKNN